jgi:PKD repeat protein
MDQSFGRFEWLNPHPTGNALNGVSWSPDGSVALVVGASGTLISYDGVRFTQLYTNSSLDFTDVAWYPSGEYALITATGGKLLKYQSGGLSEIPTGTAVDLNAITINPNTGLGLIVGEERTILLHGPGGITTISSGGTFSVSSASWEPSGSYAIIGGYIPSQMNSGTLLRYWPQNGTVRAIPTNITSSTIRGVSFSPNDEVALIVTTYLSTQGNQQTRILYWNDSGLKSIMENIPPTQAGAVDWSPDGSYAYTVCNQIYKFNWNGTAIRAFTVNGNAGTMSWDPDGSSALIVGLAGYVALFDDISITFIGSNAALFGFTINSAAWNPDGSVCVAVGSLGQIAAFDGSRITTQMVRVKGTIQNFNGVAWAPDGSFALVVGDAGAIVKYHSDRTVETNIQSGTVQNFRAVAWAPDGTYALIVGDSGTVRKFSGSVSTPVPSVTEYTLRAIAFRPNDSMAFIVGGDVRSVQGPTGAVRTSWQVVLQYNGRIITTNRVIQQGPVFNSISFSPAVIAADGGNMILIEDSGPYNHYNLTVASNMLAVTWLGQRKDALFLGEGGTAALLNFSRRDIRQMMSPTVQPFTAVAMRPQGDYALCAGWNGMMLKYFPNAPPAAVTLNKPTNVTDNALQLSWSVNNDLDFNRYELYQSSLQNFSTFKYILNSSEPGRSSLLVTGLTKQTTYYFKLRVYDNAGLIADSNIVSATTLIGNIAPVAVILGAPFSITNSSMALRWSRNGDGDFARYELHKGTSKGFNMSGNTLLASLTNQGTNESTAANLASSTTYYFKVRTYDTGGLFNDSNEVNATSSAINVPPVAVVLSNPTDISDSSMRLGWSRNNDSDFDRYELHFGNASGFNLSDATLVQILTNQSATSYTVNDLEKNTTYYFRLRVVDTSGLFNDSNQVSGATSPPNAAPRPVTLSPPTAIGETTVSLEWSKNNDGDFKQYEVAGATQNGFNITTQNTFTTLVDRNQTTYTVTDLSSNTTYFFKIRVNDQTNLFADSNEVSAVTEPNQPPAAVSLYWPINETEESMGLEWSVSDASDFDRYELYMSQTEGFQPEPGFLVTQIFDPAAVRHTVIGLSANTTYFFRVSVYDTLQLRNDSNEVNATTRGPDIPPAAPTLADPENITEASVLLEWTPNTEADFAKYLVHRATSKGFNPSSSTTVANITDIRTTSYNVTGLKANTLYYFKVEVVDLGGGSNTSNEVSARTLTINILPTCDAGGDRTVTVNTVVEFRPTASDPDGQIILYEWDFDNDGDWDANSSTGAAAHLYSLVGIFPARLRVEDNRGGSANSWANITVVSAVSPNILPVILDMGEQTISAFIGDEVFFPANATDPDGVIVKYQWDFKGDGLYEYSSASDANTTYVYDSAGNYSAVLRVTDDRDGMTLGYRNVVVTRLDSAPEAKIDAPREDQKFYVNDLITLNGQSSSDPDGDRITFLWENAKDSRRLGTSALVKLTLEKGDYAIRLTVSDGELSSWATVNITVADKPNTIPTIKIEIPLNNAVVKGLVTITGSAKDENKVEKVEIKVDPTGSWKTATGTKTWSFELDTKPLAAGPHTIYARSYDGMDYSTEATIKLTVQNPVEKAAEKNAVIPGFQGGVLALTLLLAGAWLASARRKS